ncbi:auxin-responsive protein SAUR72-like [Senna tora]|uniref:Auxin-responsive protein SAUR72-like n=1 Tax=Senna tora TaxID=362788 RepID=A0A834WDK9_9FABA|nr:auxin-responsive protein SAUR72-like [Senna tora]
MKKSSMVAKVMKKSWSWSSKEVGVPEDVREGHFAVVAVKGEERKRFIVKLECLSNPEFMILLEQAKEEYGFGQKGALVLPYQNSAINLLQVSSLTKLI